MSFLEFWAEPATVRANLPVVVAEWKRIMEMIPNQWLFVV
jgi:hypothetical protein